jgi:hypothetical protein
VAALNVAHRERTNVPVLKLIAPKQATDLPIGTWNRTGSLISGGTHTRQRVPCCWKWHSSTLQSSTPRRRARRCKIFKHRNRIGLGYLGSGFAQPDPHLAEDTLALAHLQSHPIAPAKRRREQRAVSQMTDITKRLWVASQVRPQRRPLRGIQPGWPTRPRSVTQAGQSMGFEARHPALQRSSIFPKQVVDLLATVAADDQQQPVQPIGVRDSLNRAISCWMARRITPASAISVFS